MFMKSVFKMMSKRGLALFLALMMCITMLPVAAFAAEGSPETEADWKAWVEEQLGDNKFVAVLASKLSDGNVDAVVGTVDNSYNAKLVLPNSANSGSAVIGVGMKNVASLEVDGVKSHAMILRNGEGSDVEGLSNLMDNLYSFQGATVKAAIVETDGKKHPVTYTISEAAEESGKTTITATPDAGVSEAWHAMVNETNFAIGEKEDSDSFVTVANGSWLQVGDKLLQFESDEAGDLKLDNIRDLSTLDTEIRNAVELVNAENKPVCFHLEAGTELAVSNSYARLLQPVTVTSNIELDGQILEDLRTNGVNGGLTALLTLMNGVLDQVNGKEVTVEIKFGEPTGYNIRTAVDNKLADNIKFVGVVASTLKDGTTTEVVGTVDSSYKATLTIPDKSVNPNSLYLGVGMNDVTSLGGGKRIHGMGEIKLLGDKNQNDLPLFDTLNGAGFNALRDFTRGTVNATIKAPEDAAGKSVTYTLASDAFEAGKAKVITATPGEGVSDAWHLMVNDKNFTVAENAGNDSKIVIASGSWLQIGNKKLQFAEGKDDINLLSNTNADTVESILDKVELVDDKTDAISFYLTKGTELAVSSSSAKLARDVKVSFTGVTAEQFEMVENENFLVSLQKAVHEASADTTGMTNIIIQLASLMNKAVAAVDQHTIGVDIEFLCNHEMVKTDAKEANCTEAGNNEYWTCSVCHKVFKADQTTETTVEDETIAAKGHTLVKTDAKEANCTEAGNNEYYTCSVCRKVFKDEAGTQETTVAAETIAATGHEYGEPEWSPDHTSVSIVCETCDDIQRADATVTSEITTPAQVGVAGERTYTATATLNGRTYTDTWTEVIPALPDDGGEEINPNPVPLVDPLPYDDVTEADENKGIKGDWFAADVRYMYENEIMTGTSENLFSPESPLTRGQIVTILYRLEGKPEVTATKSQFTDVPSDQYYFKAIVWATENGIAKGYSDTIFRPGKNVNREEMAAFMSRYATYKKYEKKTGDISKYADASSVSDYAVEDMAWANATGLINGRTETTLVPKGNTKRSEAAAIITRFCKGYNVFPEDAAE